MKKEVELPGWVTLLEKIKKEKKGVSKDGTDKTDS